jgi:hypothetical protein
LGKEYRSFSYSLCNFFNSPVTSSLLGPNSPFLLTSVNIYQSTRAHIKYINPHGRCCANRTLQGRALYKLAWICSTTVCTSACWSVSTDCNNNAVRSSVFWRRNLCFDSRCVSEGQ